MKVLRKTFSTSHFKGSKQQKMFNNIIAREVFGNEYYQLELLPIHIFMLI